MADYEKKEDKESDEELLKDAKKGLQAIIDVENPERRKMEDDLRFCTLDQWPADIRRERENDLENGPRPCLTIDKINQYIVQVVNDFRQGKPGINVRPMDDEADVETAKVLKGIVRNIEDQSNADIAYATAVESAAKIGLGYFRITTEYVDDSFNEQEIFIKPIPNTFAVYLGEHIMPDGSDAKEAFVVDSMPVEEFKEKYPGKKWKAQEFSGLGDKVDYWHTGERVTLVEYYCLEKIDQTLYFLADGTTISQKDYDSWPAEAGAKPSIQDKRTGFREQLKWSKLTGCDVLEKRDLPGKYIPIVEVIGRESHIDGKRILWGLVRPAKDSLRMYNYFASTITEKMGLAPKAPFIGAVGQFEGVEDKWKKANRTNYAYLEYKPIDVNGNALPRPERQGPTPMEAALLHQMQVIEHDVQTSLGMFKAAVGETESQQSGRALLALQKQSDTGTYHFGANGGIAIRHGGRIIIDMIPHYYDTKTVKRILGEDGSVETVQLDPNQDKSHRKIQTDQGIKSIYNPNIGKYDVSITVGPSYNTKRMETAATLTEVLKGNPQLMGIMGDLFFRSLDFPYSDQIAERMKMMLPPQLQQGSDPKALLMQAQQKMKMMGEQMQEMQQENVQLKAGAQVKMAEVQVDAQQKDKQHQLATAAEKAAHQLKVTQTEGEANFNVWKARLEASTKIEVAQIAAKGKLAETVIQAENDANIELSTALKGEGNDVENMVPPITRLTQMHQQGIDQHSQSMEQLGSYLQQLVLLQQQTLQAIMAPKSVSIEDLSFGKDGNPTGATVNSRPVLN